MTKFLLKRAALFFCLLGAVNVNETIVQAQIDTGSVTGTVKDSTGAVIAGAAITLTANQTGIPQKVQSTSTGTYVFDAVAPGSYTLHAEKAGFKMSVHTGLIVNVQQSLTVDIMLTPGGLNTEVVVSAGAPLLQTENGALGQTVDSEMVNDMPLVGRDWVSLAQISAGVATAYPGDPSTDAGTTGSAYFAVNGINMWQNDIRLNGIDDNIEMYGGSKIATNATITPPPDAIQQFRLQSGDFDAEFGHSTGGIVNAVTKSGTNTLHGDAWDYLRNSALQANSYFAKQQNQPVPPYRQNQFGITLGGPVVLPKIYNGHDKTFFFIDYQGLRAYETNLVYSTEASVPTALEQSSDFTNLQDIIADNLSTGTTFSDSLGRVFPLGTVMDPATTRTVAGSATDPVSGVKNTSKSSITVRDPFYTNGSIKGIKNFTGDAQYLNMLPPNRLDPNAVALLHLYPMPTTAGVVTNNYYSNPSLSYNQDQEDARIDHVFGPKDSAFISGDYSHIDIVNQPYLPGLIVGDGDGEAQSYPAWATAVGYNHAFSSTLINEFHVGYDHFIENVRSLYGNTFGIPAAYGIEGIPQIPNNGGLPSISISGLTTAGVPDYVPTLEAIHALEFMENLTKVYGAHTFKVGAQLDMIAGDITQPESGRGSFDYNGEYSQPTNKNESNTAIADMLLTPIPSPLPASDNPEPYDEGGLHSYSGSNYAATDDTRHYFGTYIQDDWKFLPTLTLNLGMRWEFTSPYEEIYGRQANFIQPGGNGPGGTYYIPNQACNAARSTGFNSLLASYNIQIVCTPNKATGLTEWTNWAPRVGFNWRTRPNFVVRGGYGIAYGGLANIGYGGTLGTNYPFIYDINSPSTNSNSVPLLLSTNQTATMESVFSTVNLSNATLIDGVGLSLYGRQYNYKTPYVETFNLMLQSQFTAHDALQWGYVGAMGRHLDNYYDEHNSPTELLTNGTTVSNYLPFPELAENSTYETTIATSNYNALQTTYQHLFHGGLNFIGNYTWSKCLSDQQTQARGTSAYRAPWLPGFGIRGDYGVCDIDARGIFHAAGTYQIPVGRGRMYLSSMSRGLDALAGGWQVNFIFSHQTGQPFTIGCATATSADFGCFANVNPGAGMYTGPHNATQWLNPAAFKEPPSVTTDGQTDLAPLGGQNQQAVGPPFSNLDSSLFKEFQLHENWSLQFRAEAFNTLNSAQLAQPTAQNNYNDANFSEITALRHPPRIIQLAAKLFW